MSKANAKLEPGTLVALDHEDDPTEYGVVVHCFQSRIYPNACFGDCRVAFFGDKIPSDQENPEVYVLRYMASSLRVVSVAAPAPAPACICGLPGRYEYRTHEGICNPKLDGESVPKLDARDGRSPRGCTTRST